MRRHDRKLMMGGRTPRQHNTSVRSRPAERQLPVSNRARGGYQLNERLPFVPPEDWHEPVEGNQGYRCIMQAAGAGYRHVLTPADVRARLELLPADFVRPLEVLQFSRMTRKKQSFPCYGMQWGSTIYLYPIEESLVEYYHQPPKPNQVNEARMYGGSWQQESRDIWKLVWTEEAIRDFYLNNILIHELGHLLDDRNSRSVDRERYAEWFAVQYGYAPTRSSRLANRLPARRRHHSQH